MFGVGSQVAGEPESGDFSRAFNTRNQGHQSRINGVEVKENGHPRTDRGVAMTETKLWQTKNPRLVDLDRFSQSFAGHVADHSTQVQRFFRFALLHEFCVPRELIQEIIERLLVISGLFQFLLEQSKMVRKVLRRCVHRRIVAYFGVKVTSIQKWFLQSRSTPESLTIRMHPSHCFGGEMCSCVIFQSPWSLTNTRVVAACRLMLFVSNLKL